MPVSLFGCFENGHELSLFCFSFSKIENSKNRRCPSINFRLVEVEQIRRKKLYIFSLRLCHCFTVPDVWFLVSVFIVHSFIGSVSDVCVPSSCHSKHEIALEFTECSNQTPYGILSFAPNCMNCIPFHVPATS